MDVHFSVIGCIPCLVSIPNPQPLLGRPLLSVVTTRQGFLRRLQSRERNEVLTIE